MKKLLLIAIIVILLYGLSMDGMAKTPKVIDINFTNIGLDSYLNLNRYIVNISVNTPGHLTYIEEYYTVDGSSNPRFCCSSRYYDGELIASENYIHNDTENDTYNASFEMLRPRSHGGKVYTVIKRIAMLNDSRIYESWKTPSDITIIDDTNSGLRDEGDALEENITMHETRERILSVDHPTTFGYTNIGSLYEINATGEGDTSLRIEILNDAPSFTYLSTGIAYRYINIFTDNYKINTLSIKYKIENSWMNNGSIKKLGLFVWNSNEKRWIGLPTAIIDKDNEYRYFESSYVNISQDSLSKFSPFAIIGFGPNVPSREDNINNRENSNISNNSNSDNKTDNSNNKTDNSTHNSSISNVEQKSEPVAKNANGVGSILIIIIFLLIYYKTKR